MKLSPIRFIIFLFIFYGTFSFAGERGSRDYVKDSLRIVEILNELKIEKLNLNESREDSISRLVYSQKSISDSLIDDLLVFSFARHYYTSGNLDEAFKIVEERINNSSENDFLLAKYYNLKGVILSLRKDFTYAIETYLKAANLYYEQGNKLREAMVYNNVSNIYLALGDHSRSYHYVRLCFKELRKHPEHPNYPGISGVLAICEINLDLLDSAKVHIRSGLSIARETNNIVGLTILNYAKGELEYKRGNLREAVPYALESLDFSEKYGLNQYALISHTFLLKVYNELEEYEKAIKHGLEAERYHQFSDNKSVLHSVKEQLSEAFANTGEFKKAYEYRIYSDSIKELDRKKENKAFIDSLLIRYESVQNKNELLSQKNKLSQQQVEIQNQRWIFSGISVLFVLLLVLGVLYYRFKRQRYNLEKSKQQKNVLQAVKEGEEKERIRVSSELHDGLASELTALRISLEQMDDVNEEALDMVRNANTITRRISHNLSPLILEQKGLVNALDYFVQINKNSKHEIVFFSNIKSDLPLKAEVASILYRCSQEIIQNAIKHSLAQNINVQVLRDDNKLLISVEDDGIGFNPQQQTNSIGLSSIEKRIELIGGKFSFDTSEENGSTFFIKYLFNYKN